MTRNRYSAEQKVAILREQLEKNISVPDICEKYRIHPNQFYKWKKELFENAAEIFSAKRSGKKDNRAEKLERILKDRNEVIAELMQENLKLKKESGEI
jgi:transposase